VRVVSDTGPLIALAKVDLLPLFGQVSIPPAVQVELFAKRGPEAPRLEEALWGSIQVETAFTLPKDVERLTRGLGEGERQAIGLALHLRTALVIDERSGRFAAKQLGVKMTGTVGVLYAFREISAPAGARGTISVNGMTSFSSCTRLWRPVPPTGRNFLDCVLLQAKQAGLIESVRTVLD